MMGLRACRSALALLAGAAAPAFALAPETAVTADRAIEIQKDLVRETVGTLPCRRDSADGDIVVCGRRGPDPNRVPFPNRRVPGEPENLLPGEIPRARDSVPTCEFGCPSPVTITDKDVRKYSGRILRHALGKDD